MAMASARKGSHREIRKPKRLPPACDLGGSRLRRVDSLAAAYQARRGQRDPADIAVHTLTLSEVKIARAPCAAHASRAAHAQLARATDIEL